MIWLPLAAVLLSWTVGLTVSQGFSLDTSVGKSDSSFTIDFNAFDPAALLFPHSSKVDHPQPNIEPSRTAQRTRGRFSSSRNSMSFPRNPFSVPSDSPIPVSERSRDTHVSSRSRGIPLSRISRTRARSRTLPERNFEPANRVVSEFTFTGLDQAGPTRESKRIISSPRTSDNFIKKTNTEPIIGVSPCARGSAGKACRMHLQATAMTCTHGSCFQCQNCNPLSPSLWVDCCRDHFLCCRPLARACQTCDQTGLRNFCKSAFGRCQ